MKAKPKKPAARKPRCCNPDCPTKGIEYTRGLCEPCYRSLRRLIEVKGTLTWADAEMRGLCRKPKPSGFKRFPVEAMRKVKATAEK